MEEHPPTAPCGYEGNKTRPRLSKRDTPEQSGVEGPQARHEVLVAVQVKAYTP